MDFFKGYTYNELSKKYHLDPLTLRRIAEENNFGQKNNNRINKNIKNNYFSNIDSPVKAYWLGFLFTDGSVDNYKATPRIRISLQESDKEHLEKLKKELSLDCKLYKDKRINKEGYSLEFTSKQIGNDIAKYGIIPNKTYESHHIYFENIPKKYIPAFLLGLFDGDGCLTYSKDFSKDVTLNFTSYYETVIEDFQKQIDLLINKEKHNKNIFTSAWHTQWRGRLQVLKILDILYDNCPIHLDRKYEKYLLLKNSLK